LTQQTISETIDRALKSAGLDLQSATLRSVTSTIKKALAAAGLAQPERQPRDMPAAERRAERPAAGSAFVDADVIDVDVRELEPEVHGVRDAEPEALTAPAAGCGRFSAGVFAHAAGSLKYMLYVPSTYDGAPMPLIVMLHGCRQDPDDFATGTRMNEWAERRGFLVAYPAQSARANGSNCWNWFEPPHQARGAGEPAALAGLVQDIVRQHAVDPKRVFVAGLSAGAAMAVILGQAYPEIFAGVGAHSGLPHGAARDVGSAFAAMKGTRQAPASAAASGIRTIVFHGDRDRTVVASNGEAIVAQALPGEATAASETASAAGGSTRTVYRDAAGRARVEHWVLHGAGHAWSGGDADGSFTSAQGPDASAEMVRFFLES
jgi:poly(hydroxyalkanoate) depolymerase family esterase